jgi:hypothetical protein
MYALNWTRDLAMDDGLEPLAPIDPPAQMAATGRVLHGALAPVTAAMGGVLVAILVIMTGPFADTLAVALGGTAALVYLGTALVSGRPAVAALDLAAATATTWIALAAAGPAVSVLLVHVLWAILRGAWPGAAPGRGFAASWAAMNAMAALLLGFGS